MTTNFGVTIEQGPMDWQIIPRDGNNVGSVTIRGTWRTLDADFSIQGRIVDERTQMPVTCDLDWRDAEMDPANARFTLTLDSIPAGGLYRLETRLRRPTAPDRRAMRGDCIHHLGVGDLYVIAGQSNASGTGKGAVTDGPQLGVHLFANDERWKLATHPIEDATGTHHPITITSVFHGHSPWLAFGKHVYARTGIPVGLIPTALGGSPISQWITDSGEPGCLSENLMDMVTKAGGRVAGVLWHQGESDAVPEAIDLYARRFEKWVTWLRRALGNSKLPIITGQINGWIYPQQEPCLWTRMREIQRSLARRIDHVTMAVTIDCPLSDEIHNSAASNVMIGERYGDLALEHIYGHRIQAGFPEPAQIRFTDAGRRGLEIRFINIMGDWTPGTADGTFRVEDDRGPVPVEKVEIITDNRIRITLGREAKQRVMVHACYGIRPAVGLRDDSGRCLTPFSLPVKD